MSPLILKRTSASRSSGQWRDDDHDVLEDGGVVGPIFTAPTEDIFIEHKHEMLTGLQKFNLSE
jgi:hypothetical protein